MGNNLVIQCFTSEIKEPKEKKKKLNTNAAANGPVYDQEPSMHCTRACDL